MFDCFVFHSERHTHGGFSVVNWFSGEEKNQSVHHFSFHKKQRINEGDDATDSSLKRLFNRSLLCLKGSRIHLHYKVVTSISWMHFNYTSLNCINYARTLPHQRDEPPDAASELVAPRWTSHWDASPKGVEDLYETNKHLLIYCSYKNTPNFSSWHTGLLASAFAFFGF